VTTYDLSRREVYNGGQVRKQIRAVLLQFRVLCLGLFQDEHVGVGVIFFSWQMQIERINLLRADVTREQRHIARS
jgi:hypothetical protein